MGQEQLRKVKEKANRQIQQIVEKSQSRQAEQIKEKRQNKRMGQEEQTNTTQKEKQFRDRKRSVQKKSGRYKECIIGLVLIVLTAFFLPQVTFAFQDYYQMNNIFKEERDNASLFNLKLSYEKDLKSRMTNFAAGLADGKKFNVTSTDYSSENILEYIETALDKHYLMHALISEGIMPVELTKMSVSDMDALIKSGGECKRYTIYDEEYEGGIAFSCLYLDIPIEEGRRVQMLMDTEDRTFYYLKCTGRYDNYYDYNVKRKQSVTVDFDTYFWVLQSMFNSYSYSGYSDYQYSEMDYYLYYIEAPNYAADIPEDPLNINFSSEQDIYDVYGYNETDESVQIISATLTEAEKIAAEREWIKLIETYQLSEMKQVVMKLPYGENFLKLALNIYQSDKEGEDYTLTFGIEDIGKLIPELASD